MSKIQESEVRVVENIDFSDDDDSDFDYEFVPEHFDDEDGNDSDDDLENILKSTNIHEVSLFL